MQIKFAEIKRTFNGILKGDLIKNVPLSELT